MNLFTVTGTDSLAVLLPLIHLLGAVHAIDAVMNVRTPQGAIAWSISLVTFPYLAVPFYWIFGRARLRPYYKELRHRLIAGSKELKEIRAGFSVLATKLEESLPVSARILEGLAGFPFTTKNQVKLLIDGRATFDAIFKGIEEAREYILVQFYIVRDDELGRRLRDRLIIKAKEGVKVYFLYDSIGCYLLSGAYIASLAEAGVEIQSFGNLTRTWQRFSLNFRNHKKIVVIDGKRAFVGGHNVGNEYLSDDPKRGHWRDTHIEIKGPAALSLQSSFVQDWHSVTGNALKLPWKATECTQSKVKALVVPSSPADQYETNSLFFTHLIDSARNRYWISSPYFVPDASVMNALILAVLRGVDVRIMIPRKIDHLLVQLASFSFLSVMEKAGVGIFRYQDGILHQKAALLDDEVSVVGTSNLDNRSFRLNLEVSVLVADKVFAGEVEDMFNEDFTKCAKITANEYEQSSFLFKVCVRLAGLLSPIL